MNYQKAFKDGLEEGIRLLQEAIKEQDKPISDISPIRPTFCYNIFINLADRYKVLKVHYTVNSIVGEIEDIDNQIYQVEIKRK